MKQDVSRKIVYGVFVTVLVILFLWKFGHPAVVKFIREGNEVFLKISTQPSDRAKIEKIPLPAVTFCASDVSSALSQGWKTVSMSYGDMISSMCNGSTTIQEVYDCINTNTYNLTEVVPSLSQGASIPKYITDTSVWQTDVSAVFLGKCHTLKYPDKVASNLETNIMWFTFEPGLTYDVFIHDPKYYLATLNPAAYPHIRLKRKPTLPINESRNFDLLYVRETKHVKLNRAEYPCQEGEEYDFRQCVKRSVYTKVGCKMEWDGQNFPEFSLCTEIQQLKDYEREFLQLSQVEEREVIQQTGCLPPCSYSQFSLVHNIEGFYQVYGMGLVYATTEVRLEEEDWVYPSLSFIAEFGGALGMFVGFSFMTFWDCFVWGFGKYKKKSQVEETEMTSDGSKI